MRVSQTERRAHCESLWIVYLLTLGSIGSDELSLSAQSSSNNKQLPSTLIHWINRLPCAFKFESAKIIMRTEDLKFVYNLSANSRIWWGRAVPQSTSKISSWQTFKCHRCDFKLAWPSQVWICENFNESRPRLVSFVWQPWDLNERELLSLMHRLFSFKFSQINA